MNWAYLIPASAAILMAMLAAHWSPAFEGSHALWRYAWGVGWIAGAVAGQVVLDPGAPAWTALMALVFSVLAAAAGTGAGYLYDALRAMRSELERRRGR